MINYTPRNGVIPFHSDVDSRVKFLFGGVRTGTTTALLMDMLMNEHEEALVIVPSLSYWMHGMLPLLHRWWFPEFTPSTTSKWSWHALHNHITVKVPHMIDFEELQKVDYLYVSGLDMGNTLLNKLFAIHNATAGHVRIIGEFNPPKQPLPFAAMFPSLAIYRMPEVLDDTPAPTQSRKT